MASISMELRGLKEAQRATERAIQEMHGPPLLNAMRDATLAVTRTARMEAKSDTGRYRASIVPDVTMHGSTVVGVVGTNVRHAPFAVLDTRPHWPPRHALEVWARRHRIPVFLVMRAIARRGTRGDQSLIKGLEQNAERIVQLLDRGVELILRNWEK